MKKYFVYIASAVLMMAACAKEDINTPVETPVVGETEFISIELNPATRTILDGTKTNWSAGDAVGVYFRNESIGTLTLVEGSTNKFEGEIESALLLGQDNVTLKYPADVTAVPTTQVAVAGSFANGAALLEGSVKLKDLRAGKSTVLQNMTALLQFKTPVAGDVAFTIGTTTYTVTGCAANTTYYACVDPAVSGKLSYTVGLALGGKEKASFSTEANKVYNLDALTLKESSIYAVTGDNNTWGDTKMYETAQDNFFVLYGVNFSANGGFKIRKAGSWVEEYNYGTANETQKSANSVIGVFTHGDSADIKVAAGKYDIYFDRAAGQVYLMESGKPYTEGVKQATPGTTYSLIGSFTGSNWNTDINMTYSGDGIWTVVQKFAANDEWKIRETGNWSVNYNSVWVGWGNKTDGSDGNIKMKAAGDYIITYVEKNKKNQTNFLTLLKK